MEQAGDIHVHFSEGGKLALNICLALVMLGVSLELKPSDFYRVVSVPRTSLIGLVAQIILFPLLTFGLIMVLHPALGIALGMLLVAACPGGNVSNFLTSLANGNTALSVTITAITSVLAVFTTPFIFMFWSRQLPNIESLPQNLTLNPADMIGSVLMVIIIPLIVGMILQNQFPKAIKKIIKPARIISILILVAFIALAVAGNWAAFSQHIGRVLFFVILHNAMALASGYLFARLWRLNKADSRAISIETGIKNSGLGLVLIFNFFGGQGEMALVAAAWGTWHIIAGFAVATFWSKSDVK